MNAPLAVALSLTAALLFAAGSVAQQRAAADVPDGRSLVAGLAGSGRWWAGLLGDSGGYLVQVAALAVGSVLIVQPLLVTTLLVALPLAARFSGTRVDRSSWISAIALSAGLVVFLVVGNPSEGRTDAPFTAWIAPLGSVVGVCVVAVIAALVATGSRWRALLFGAAGGVLFGVAVVFTKAVTDLFSGGLVTVLTAWQSWALVASGLVGFYLQQRAFQAGPLSASLPAVTIGEPLGAAVLGVAVLDERLRTSTVGLVVVGAAVVVMVVTTIRLSRMRAA